MTRIFSFVFAFLFLAVSSLAHAADPFTVAGIPVDATGDTAIEAQIAATEQGQIRTAEILIKRLTLDSALMNANLPPMTIETARSLIRGQQIGNEKRSARRYLGDITVAFNPQRVKDYLKSSGLDMISTQTRQRLVIPILNGEAPNAENAWTEAWARGGFAHALTPVISNADALALITAQQAVSGDKNAIAAAAAAAGVRQVLIAQANGGEGNYRVSLTDISIDTDTRTRLGSVSGVTAFDAAARSVDSLESAWKEASVNLAANAQTMIVSVLYNSHEDWLRLQDAINSSAQITDARLDALTKDGAMMTLTVGDLGRLANELKFKGVQVTSDPKIGTYFARNGYSR
jgi:hypothetical protein